MARITSPLVLWLALVHSSFGQTGSPCAIADNTCRGAPGFGSPYVVPKPSLDHPGYVSGTWSIPYGTTVWQTATALSANTINYLPVVNPSGAPIVITTLGLREGGTAAAGNIQAAVYGSDPVTHKPAGFALSSTASISTAGASTDLSAVLGNTGATTVTLKPGVLYYLATNTNTATPIFAVVGVAGTVSSWILNSPTQTNMLAGVTATLNGYTSTQTFGTWPDVTAATFTEVLTPGIPVVMFKVQ